MADPENPLGEGNNVVAWTHSVPRILQSKNIFKKNHILLQISQNLGEGITGAP